MYCEKCGTENNDAAKFCKKCGTKIMSEAERNKPTVSFCPHCGQKQDIKRVYCLSCGRPLNMPAETEKDSISSVKAVGCIISMIDIIVEIILIWSGNFVRFGSNGTSAGDVMLGMLKNIDNVFDVLGSGYIKSGEGTAAIIIVIGFIIFFVSAVVALIAAIVYIANKAYDKALQKIFVSAVSLIINAGALVFFAIYLKEETSRILSVGISPIICLILSVCTAIYVGVVRSK